MKTILTNSASQTEQAAAAFAKTLHAPAVVAFFGGLGMGKTAFTRGLAKGLGIDAEVSSPTFALVPAYEGKDVTLYHYDMYRVQTWEDLESTGFFDDLARGGIFAVEWSENIENALPKGTIRVTLSPGEEQTQRIITIEDGENET